MIGQPAAFAPGTEKVYNNANINLLGPWSSEATGQDFDEVLDERILEPLGQEDTRYIVDVSTWDAPHAVGYTPDEDGLAVTARQPVDLRPGRVDGLDPGGRTRVGGDPRHRRAAGTGDSDRAPGGSAPGCRAAVRHVRARHRRDGQWWGHNGEGFGFTAALFHQPDTGASIVVFMNLSGHPSDEHPADQLFRRLAAVIESGAVTRGVGREAAAVGAARRGGRHGLHGRTGRCPGRRRAGRMPEAALEVMNQPSTQTVAGRSRLRTSTPVRFWSIWTATRWRSRAHSSRPTAPARPG